MTRKTASTGFSYRTRTYLHKKQLLQEYPNSKDKCKRQYETTINNGIWNHRWDIQQVEGQPILDGEIQGTMDTPPLFSMLSNVAIQAHKSYTPGLTLESPTLHREITHQNIAYVDDANGHVSYQPTTIQRIQSERWQKR